MSTLSEISEILTMKFVGDGNLHISGLAEPKLAKETELALAMDKKFVGDLEQTNARVALVLEGTDWKKFGLQGALLVSGSRTALSEITGLFEDPLDIAPGIHPTAIISKTARLGKNVSIGPFSVISAGVKIMQNSVILSHVYIGKKVKLGKGSVIHAGARIGSKVKIGNHFICHPNAVVGSDGFSFVAPITRTDEKIQKETNSKTENKQVSYPRIASIGSVDIGNDVEIGASSTIDKGTIANTKIGNGTKLDNLVHVAHNVEIGNHCLLCGQVGVAGSAKIGNRVILGGQVGIADHVTVGDSCIVAGKSGVSSNIPAGQFMMGNPAMKIENNIAAYKSLRRLPRIIKQIQNLQKTILR
tara:strand:- start:31 stop:1104 length:1074 start_codon:yes stop_codon:yes gene_type:complete